MKKTLIEFGSEIGALIEKKTGLKIGLIEPIELHYPAVMIPVRISDNDRLKIDGKTLTNVAMYAIQNDLHFDLFASSTGVYFVVGSNQAILKAERMN
jgi:uncharacterized protein YkvS